MYRKNYLLKNLSLSACIAISAFAQDAKLDDVEVVSSAFDAYVKTITNEQLDNQQASDIKDILKSLPSVEVNGSTRYGQKVYIRGLEDKFANITIDGAKISGQLFHHTGDQTIDASLLKISSVELGPNSALSGSGVVNGSFKYETKDPSDFLKDGENFGGQLSLGYQTANERKKGSLSLFGKVNEKVEFVGIGTITDDDTLHLGNGAEEENKDSKLESFLGKIIVKPNENNTLKFSYNSYNDSGDRYIAPEKSGGVTDDDDLDELTIKRDTFTISYDYNPNSDLVNLEAEAYTTKQEMEYSKDVTNEAKGYDLRNTSIIGMHNITYGTDFTNEEQEVENDSDTIKGGEVDTFGLYAQDEMAINNLVLTLGARYDHAKLGGIYDGSFDQISPKAKLSYHLSENLTLRTAYGRIFKGPALGETYMLDTSTIVQVDNTKAQTGNNYEIGFDYDLSSALNADDAVFGFNVYRYNLDNYAHVTKNNSIAAQGDMEMLGFETMFTYSKDNLKLRASHTYSDGDYKEYGGEEDDAATKIHVFKIGAEYDFGSLHAAYDAEFVPGNDYKDYSSRTGETTTEERSGYGVHNINFTYTPQAIKNTKFYFGVDNIFDKGYIRHTAFGAKNSTADSSKSYELGRNFKFQVAYRF